MGGSVRDGLMGRTPKDRDYVVVGSTPQEMLDSGFTQVGAAFPVFLHPETGEEYALARKERKTGPGYNGFEVDFDPSVTLEEDLSRRDLTINSIAYDEENDCYIDPFNGIDDIRHGIIRHTSNAFSEDPLRVLRVARFLARYDRFVVAPETIELCRQVVSSKEFDELTVERVWVELWKIFDEKRTSNAIKFLFEIGAHTSKRLHKIFEHVNEIRDAMIFCEFSELRMSAIDKLVMFTNIVDLEKTQVNELKIPKDIYRDAMFISDAKAELFCEDFDFEFIDTLIRSYRELYRNNGISLVGHHVAVLYPETKMKLGKLKAAFDAVLGFDFTDLTKDVPTNQISSIVKDKRIQLITDALQKETL